MRPPCPSATSIFERYRRARYRRRYAGSRGAVHFNAKRQMAMSSNWSGLQVLSLGNEGSNPFMAAITLGSSSWTGRRNLTPETRVRIPHRAPFPKCPFGHFGNENTWPVWTIGWSADCLSVLARVKRVRFPSPAPISRVLLSRTFGRLQVDDAR